MSAAATAAGYLYASGRLRGRNAREDEAHEPEQKPRPKRKELKVAVYEAEPSAAPVEQARPKVTPKIQYRTRRWKPE
jgi:hypothetical protein